MGSFAPLGCDRGVRPQNSLPNSHLWASNSGYHCMPVIIWEALLSQVSKFLCVIHYRAFTEMYSRTVWGEGGVFWVLRNFIIHVLLDIYDISVSHRYQPTFGKRLDISTGPTCKSWPKLAIIIWWRWFALDDIFAWWRTRDPVDSLTTQRRSRSTGQRDGFYTACDVI